MASGFRSGTSELVLLGTLPSLLHSARLAFQAPALVKEATWLICECLWPEALPLKQIHRAAPYATGLILAAPGGARALEPFASEALALVGPVGITLRGVTHTNTQAMIRVIEETTRDEPRMNPGAVRSARLRLKLLLQEHGQPTLVRSSRVLARMHWIVGLSEGAARKAWEQAILGYARRYRLPLEHYTN